MNILFIVSRHSEKKEESTLTKDLADEFFRQGNNITVVTLLEKKYKKSTSFKKENGYNVLRIKTENYFNISNPIIKGIAVLKIPFDLKKGIKKYIKKEKVDLIITHTPFISSEKLIGPLKKYFNCPAHLILWDLFPQNAKDIELLTNSFLFSFFKYKEKKMLKTYEHIWCMSKGNLEYMKKNYSYLDENKLSVLKNWATLKPKIYINKSEIRKKYHLREEDFIAVFGGNMGKPQKLENLIKLAKKILLLDDKKIKFLFVGSGSEKDSLEKITERENISNIRFINHIPREEYECLIGSCDLGLISLDERFTVPNFPSKTTDYFKLSLPILASIDNCAKEDYGFFLENEAKAGIGAEAGNINDLYEKFMRLYIDKELREILGKNGRNYYEKYLNSETAYNTIMEKVRNI